MGLFDEPVTEIKKCLFEWDYSNIFPQDGSYTNTRGILFNDGWPWQLIKQFESTPNQQMEKPIISLVSLEPMEEGRSFSDIYKTGVGSGPLQWRLGRRAAPSFLISCWADQQLGGMNTCRKIGSEIYNAVFYNKNRLSKIRHLRVLHSREADANVAQLFRFDVTIEGDVFITLDV